MQSIEELERDLKAQKIANIYLLFGEETFLLETNLKKIKKLFGETIKGINYITLDEDTVEKIISDIETPAFGFEKKLIIAKNTGLFKTGAKKQKESLNKLRDKLNEYIKENIDTIKESVIVVFVEAEAGKSSLFNTIDKYGTVCKFEYQKPNQIQRRLKSICNLYKVDIDNPTMQYFLECCGTDMQDLINEIRKLIEFVGEGNTIKKEDIDKLSTKKIESIIFELTDNLGKKNTQKALEVLNNLIYQKEPIQKILITLYNHFKKLYLTKIAIQEKLDIITSLELKPNQTFLVNKYKQQASYFTEQELFIIIKELIDLDYKYKIGLIDVNIGLESILCTYCS
ncbi:MAG: DNA polymerase III subunit delta [Clostridia bacterium]|nr:DNA polymerase III subunit delta [Clostridia bacterium]